MLSAILKAISLLDRPTRRRWFALILLALLAATLEMSGAAIVFGLINLISNPANIGAIPVFGDPLAWAVARFGERTVLVLSFLVAAYFAAKNAVLLFEIYYRERCALETTAATARRLFDAYLHAPYGFHFHHNSADLIRDLETSVDATFRTVLLSAAAILSEGLVVLGIFAVLLTAEPAITLIAAASIGLISAAILLAMRAKVLAWGARMSSLRAAIVQAIQQGLGSIKEVKVLGREDAFLERFAAANDARARLTRLYATVSNAPRLVMESIMVVGLILVIAFVYAREGRTDAIIPIIGLFAYSGFRIAPSANRVILHLNNIRFGSPFVDNVIEGLSQAAALPVTARRAQPAPLPFAREVRLEGITYRYPGAHRDSLSNVALSIPAGAAIGIVGVTGAGKTTLADVLLGLLRPDRGRLWVDDRDITDDPRAWQRKIGYVPQVIYLTDDTIAANIAFGIAPSDIEAARLRRAAEMAQISDFVEAQPKKFETFVGERGIRLSGGQRQRIGIARALYNDPDLLVFDEATSALDSETEAEIGRAIQRFTGIKTIVLIAHRLSTLRACATLVMMQDGGVIAEGGYDHLLRTCEPFRRLASPDSTRGALAPSRSA